MTVILNNNTINVDKAILSLALYGYACFTSLAVEFGKTKGLRYHIARLLNDSDEIFGISPKEIDIRKNIRAFLDEQSDTGCIVVRVTIFPDNFSLAVPEKIDSLSIMVTGRAYSFPNGSPMRLHCANTVRTLPFQKTTNMLSNLKARAESHKSGFDDVLMINNNVVTEGATWNIFFGNGDQLITPLLSSGILPGVTRRLVLENAGDIGFSINERVVKLSDLKEYTYCFVTNAVIGISPIRSIGDIEYDTNSENLEKRYYEIQEDVI